MNYKSLLVAITLTLCIWACKTIASFDQYAYTQDSSLKIEVLNLMDSSASSYNSQANNCQKVITDLLKIREYEKHRPKDGITFKMWE